MSIRRLRARLIAASDSGISMIEVLVALMVFSILAVGMLFALTTMTRLSADTENREVAVSLASQEIDKVRAVPDTFDVLDSTTTQTISGVTFTITRTQSWVSTSGSTANCGGSGGNLQYKSVDVKVTWSNQLVLKNPVDATTALAPSSRINDPSYGTIIVSVTGADGTGRAGITPIITATSGGGAITSIDPTDSDGCSYVLKVKPGTYSIQLNKSGYIDYGQSPTPVKSYPITAGASQPVAFSYDQQANYTLKYASNFTTGTAKLPDALTTNYLSSSGPYATTATTTPIALYPKTEGYSAIAGQYTVGSSISSGCLSVDPVTWPAGPVGAVNMAAGVRSSAGVAAGATGPLNIPMGVVKVTWPTNATSITVRGIVAATGPGDPGCAQPTDYTFSYTTVPTANTVVYLAVPFGSYQVYAKISGTLTLNTTSVNATQGEVTGNVITLDPRLPA